MTIYSYSKRVYTKIDRKKVLDYPTFIFELESFAEQTHYEFT